MRSWKARLLTLLAVVAMLLAIVPGSAMAQEGELLVDEDGDLFVCFEEFVDSDEDGFLEGAFVCFEVDDEIGDFEELDFDEDGEDDDEDDDDDFDFNGNGDDED